MEEKKSKRGGARKGAGRKLAGTGRRVTITARVAPETAAIVKKWREAGISFGKWIDQNVAADDIRDFFADFYRKYRK